MEQHPIDSSRTASGRTAGWKRLVLIVASAVIVVAAAAVWARASSTYVCLPCDYDPVIDTCYGITRANPAFEESCQFKKELPCDIGITGAKPGRCFGAMR